LWFETQKTLQNPIGIASIDSHLDCASKPIDGMFVPMPPNNVAVGGDLSRAFQSKTGA
jgi:hypothetical protein